MASSRLGDPWLWAGLAGLFLGAALAHGLRWLLAVRRGARRRASARSAACFLSLACLVAAGTGFAVFCPAELGRILGYLPFAGLLLLPAFLGAFFPLAAGLPLAFLALVAIFAGRAALAPFAAVEAPAGLGRLEVNLAGESGFSGAYVGPGGIAAPALARLEGPLVEAAIVVELLEAEGPAATFLGARRFRVLGFGSGGGRIEVGLPARGGVIDRLLAPPSGLGISRLGPLARRRAESPVLPLESLGAIEFRLESDGSLAASPTGD